MVAVLGAWGTEHIDGESMNTLKMILYIALILLNIADAVYIIVNVRDKRFAVDLLISGVFIGAFVMMMVDSWS